MLGEYKSKLYFQILKTIKKKRTFSVDSYYIHPVSKKGYTVVKWFSGTNISIRSVE